MRKDDDLQTIDFRLRIRMKVPQDEKAKDLQEYLSEAIKDLDGVVEVKEHSWTRHRGTNAKSRASAPNQ